MRSVIGDAARLRRSGAPTSSETPSSSGTSGRPDTPRGLPSRRTLLVLLATVVVASLVFALRGSSDNGSPPLATSCTTPAAVVGAVNGSSSLRYSITGPAEGTYVVAIDAATARVHGDGVDLTPASATAVAIKKNLKDCKANGALPSAEGGAHELVIFRDGKVVARAKIPAQ
jgi:hypothetical protein